MIHQRINGLKGQQALSPGQRPGCGSDVYSRPVRAKALQNNNSFALSGRRSALCLNTQGVALGYVLHALSGRLHPIPILYSLIPNPRSLLPILYSLISILPLIARAQAVSYTREDSLRVVELLKQGSKLPLKGDGGARALTLFYARQLMNLPYVAHTLEIKDREEHLAINLQSLDCTTLVENCCALALTTSHGSKSWQDFLSWLQKLRYDAGKIDGYKSRNHYFSQWIQSGERLGLVKEVVPPENISVPMKLSLTYMSEHPDSYPLLKVDMNERKLIAEMEKRVTGATVRYVPKERVGDSKKVLGFIKDGDIIAITTNRKGLDVSHVGFAVWGEDGKLHLLNASSIHKKVVLEPMTLYDYMQKHPVQTGIRAIRLQKP